MVIAGIGYCSVHGNFQFQRNLMEGLQIYNGSILSGVYHPRSKHSDATDRIKYHFMLSPVPYNVWPRTARFILRLKHTDGIDGQTTGIQDISQFLQGRGVAIIFSFSNRSAHRYSTWDFHVCFDNVTNQDLAGDYDDKRSCYGKVLTLASELKGAIEDKFGDILFSDDLDLDLTKSIVMRVNTALHYFYHKSEELQQKYPDQRRAYSPFTLRYNQGTFQPIDGGIINEVIRILEPTQVGLQLPSICFAEADSHYLNLRVIIIPFKLKHQFFELNVFHERISESTDQNNTSKGLLAYITRNFPVNHYKIWKSSNVILEHRIYPDGRSYCNGKLSLFMEVRSSYMEQQAEAHQIAIQTTLDALEDHRNKPDDLKHVRLKSSCDLIFPNMLQRHFGASRKVMKRRRFDVFISYSHHNIEHARVLATLLRDAGCQVFIDLERTAAGEIFSDRIRDGLRESREFCILLSASSKRSSWVTTEWGAAWAMGKFCIPVLIDLDFKALQKIDKRISERQCVKWPAKAENLRDTLVKDIITRRFESMLFDDEYNY